jgi:hypothetical protein
LSRHQQVFTMGGLAFCSATAWILIFISAHTMERLISAKLFSLKKEGSL